MLKAAAAAAVARCWQVGAAGGQGPGPAGLGSRVPRSWQRWGSAELREESKKKKRKKKRLS